MKLIKIIILKLKKYVLNILYEFIFKIIVKIIYHP